MLYWNCAEGWSTEMLKKTIYTLQKILAKCSSAVLGETAIQNEQRLGIMFHHKFFMVNYPFLLPQNTSLVFKPVAKEELNKMSILSSTR